MYNGYTESQQQIEHRRARILADFRSAPTSPRDPTLEECLQMEADITAAKLEQYHQTFTTILQSLEVGV